VEPTPERSGGAAVADGDMAAAAMRQPATSRWLRSTRTSVQFDPLTPYQLWSHLGARLGVYANGMPWWLGDWLAFGQMKYGRRYRDAIVTTGLEYQTLRNYAAVARRFEPSRRRDDVSFQHHAELCALPDEDQDQWLEQAAAHAWSRNELRRRVRPELPCKTSETTVVVRFSVGVERPRRWREAAAVGRESFDEWAVRTLDAAAASALFPAEGMAPVAARMSRRRDGPARRASAQ
jgi:hypothetical protein